MWHAPVRRGLTRYSKEFCSQFTRISTRSKTSPDVSPLIQSLRRDVLQSTQTPRRRASASACSFAYARISISRVSASWTATGTTSSPHVATLCSLRQSSLCVHQSVSRAHPMIRCEVISRRTRGRADRIERRWRRDGVEVMIEPWWRRAATID